MEKNDIQLRKNFLATLWGPFSGYFVGYILSITALYLGLGSFSHKEMLILFLAGESTVVFIFILFSMKKEITKRFSLFSSYLLQFANLILFTLFIFYLNEARSLAILIIILGLINLVNYVTYLKAFFISVTTISAYIIASIFAVKFSGQKGNLTFDIFFGAGILPTILIIVYMTKIFRTQRDNLKNAMKEIKNTRDKLWGEMEIAKQIQTVLLPEAPAIHGYEIAAYMLPADEVGGDYYDIINAGEMNWIVIGDVSGHGVPAGLIMMMVQTLINFVVKQYPDKSPSDLLADINNQISANSKKLGGDKYMTITVFAVHREKEIFFAGRHQDILIYRAEKNKVETIETDGMWLGIMDDISGLCTDNAFTLNKGDVMLLYTDGITEAWEKELIKGERNISNSMFGAEQLSDILQNNGSQPADEIIKIINKKMESYTTDDDITMIVVKRVND